MEEGQHAVTALRTYERAKSAGLGLEFQF